jgi:adenylate cyclase
MSDQAINARERLQIGEWSVDRLANELRRGEESARIESKAMEVLLVLAAQAGEVLSRDALIDAVWPGVVVGDEVLTQSIIKLRRALGDNPRAPTYIETIPKRGYRLIASVVTGDAVPRAEVLPEQRVAEVGEATGLSGPATTRTSSPEGDAIRSPEPRAAVGALVPSRRRRWSLSAAALLLVAALGLAAFGLRAGHKPTDVPAEQAAIVVLPIANLTGDGRRDLDAEDLTESLATSMARIAGLATIDPGTAFTFRGRAVDVRRVAAELGVRYVVQGELRAAPSNPVLVLRLTDARSAMQLWNSTFSAPIGDARAAREEIAAGVAHALGLQVARAEALRSLRSQPLDATTADLLARARATLRWSAQQDGASLRARPLLEQALQRDAGLSEAWVLLAHTYLTDVRFEADPTRDLQRAADATRHALALAPDNPAAWDAQAWVLYNERRMPEALAAFDQSLALGPAGPDQLAGRGAALIMLGRPDEALTPIEKAMRISPRDPRLAEWQLFAGVAELHLRHSTAAIDWLTRSVDANPRSAFAHLFLASALGVARRDADARAEMARFEQLRPGFTLSRFRAREPSDAAPFIAQRQEVYEGLRRAGMPE